MFDIILTYALLASGIVANKIVLSAVSPDLFVGIRMFLSGLLLVPIACFRADHRLRWVNLKQDAGPLFFIALCTTLVPSITKAFALKYMVASKMSLLGSIDPFVTALYAYLLWNERLSFKKLLGMIIGACGIMISVASTTGTEIVWGEFLAVSYPEIAALTSVVISRYGWLLVQMMLKKDRYRPAEINCLTMLSSGALALLISLFSGATLSVATLPLSQMVPLLAYTVLIGNLCGYTLYSYCLKKHSATWMSFAGFLVPIFVLLFGAALGRDQVTGNFIVASGTIFVGLCVFYFDDLRKSKSVTNP